MLVPHNTETLLKISIGKLLRQLTDLPVIDDLTACTSEINKFVGMETNFKVRDIFISKLEEKYRITKFPERKMIFSQQWNYSSKKLDVIKSLQSLFVAFPVN